MWAPQQRIEFSRAWHLGLELWQAGRPVLEHGAQRLAPGQAAAVLEQPVNLLQQVVAQAPAKHPHQARQLCRSARSHQQLRQYLYARPDFF